MLKLPHSEQVGDSCSYPWTYHLDLGRVVLLSLASSFAQWPLAALQLQIPPQSKKVFSLQTAKLLTRHLKQQNKVNYDSFILFLRARHTSLWAEQECAAEKHYCIFSETLKLQTFLVCVVQVIGFYRCIVGSGSSVINLLSWQVCLLDIQRTGKLEKAILLLSKFLPRTKQARLFMWFLRDGNWDKRCAVTHSATNLI